jgi:hypothetical protein
VAGLYFFIVDPYNIRPFVEASIKNTFLGEEPTNPQPAGTSAPTEGEVLSPEQQAALSEMGIDSAAVPAQITPEQEACFITVLGEERVSAIKAGEVPTLAEFVRGRECL